MLGARQPPRGHASHLADAMGGGRTRKRSSAARDAPASPAGGAQTFIADVTGAILQQSERPPYKRARAVVKGAVRALPDGALRTELENLLPAALKELKHTLAPSRPAAATATDAAPERLNVASDAAYEAAVQRGEPSERVALLLARAPPHPQLLQHLLPVPERATAEHLERTARVAGLAVASAGPADAAPIVRAALASVDQHHTSLAETLCSGAPASASLARVRLHVSALTQEQRDAHAGCCAALRRLAAVLAAHSAVQRYADDSPSLRQRASVDVDPHAATLQLALVTCVAAVHSQLMKAQKPTLSARGCGRLIAEAASEAEVLLLGVPVSSIRQALLEAVPEVVDPAPHARLAPLAWLAVVAAHQAAQLTPGSGTLSLEEVVFERHRACVLEAVGDASGAAAAISELAARRCGGDLLQWLQARTASAAAARCVASARGGSDPAALARCLADNTSLEDAQSLLQAWRADSAAGSAAVGDGIASGEADAGAARDEDLFMVDGAGAAGWLQQPWPAAAGSGSEGEDVALEGNEDSDAAGERTADAEASD